MNKTVALFVGLLLATAARDAHAKAAYQTPEVMIANSEAIALVQIDRVEATQTKGSQWTYGQKATAHVEQTLKGQWPATLTLLGDENFRCARCHFETGRFLVFLKREKAGWAGINYQPSAQKIEAEKINWDSTNPFADNPIALSSALDNIRAIAKSQTQAPHYELSSGTQYKERVWRITEQANSKAPLTLKHLELEKWLSASVPGTKVSLVNSFRGGNASPEEVQNLRSFAYSFGLEFVVVPAG